MGSSKHSAMKALLLLLFLSVEFLQLATSLSYVCPHFPFCSQDPGTGLWNSLPGAPTFPGKVFENEVKLEDHVVAYGRSIVPEEESCLTKGSYCLYDYSSLIELIKAENFEECQAKCHENEICSIFSYHQRWGRSSCALLQSCGSTVSCGKEEYCAKGTSEGCQCPKLEYQPKVKDFSTVYSNWTCDENNPYISDIPPRTSCNVTCPSWKGDFVSSTCLPNGEWSATTSSNGRTSSFPTPDEQPTFECGCPDIGPFTYNPNDESNTIFVCEGRPLTEFSKPGGWSLNHPDKCKLFCSEDSKAVTTVYCEAGEWKGEPERGFWCYDKPENPGPSDIPPTPTSSSTTTTAAATTSTPTTVTTTTITTTATTSTTTTTTTNASNIILPPTTDKYWNTLTIRNSSLYISEVGGSIPPDNLTISTDTPIKLYGISLLGAETLQTLTGKITVSGESGEVASKLFSYVTLPDVRFNNIPFDAPVALISDVEYTLTVEYFGEKAQIYRAVGGFSPMTHTSEDCDTVTFSFSTARARSFSREGQIPRILFYC